MCPTQMVTLQGCRLQPVLLVVGHILWCGRRHHHCRHHLVTLWVLTFEFHNADTQCTSLTPAYIRHVSHRHVSRDIISHRSVVSDQRVCWPSAQPLPHCSAVVCCDDGQCQRGQCQWQCQRGAAPCLRQSEVHDALSCAICWIGLCSGLADIHHAPLVAGRMDPDYVTTP